MPTFMHADSGYLALLGFLVIVPIAAVLMAVVDRAILRRRTGLMRSANCPVHAFPVISRGETDEAGEPGTIAER